MSFPINDWQAARDYASGPDGDPAEVVSPGELSSGELYWPPEVIEAEEAVVAAESVVLAAEDAGITDVIAMRRLDHARRELHDLLARRQWARARSSASTSFGRLAA